jgi:zinc/manganese transport system substrate-binding protein
MLAAVGSKARGLAVAVALVALVGSACGLSQSTAGAGKVEAVVAESFWGDIAAQLGGDRVQVTNLISSPDTDPHDYEPTPRDAQLLARARYVVYNGAGYDAWAPKLLAANPVSDRRVLDIGALLGVPAGGNPHVWYSPDYVEQVIARITADFAGLDSADKSYFEARSARFRTDALADYHGLIATIRQKYAGTPVGASESIFVYMAQATGLNLITPAEYMKAISEGTEPAVADKSTVESQIAHKQVRVFVFNKQNSTPDVQAAVDRAKAAGIPLVEITETPSPASLSFQDWQSGQLKALLAALGG